VADDGLTERPVADGSARDMAHRCDTMAATAVDADVGGGRPSAAETGLAGVVRRRALAMSVALLAVLSLLFWALPGVDLTVTRWAHGLGEPFPLSRDPTLLALRWAGLAVTRALAVVFVAIALLKLVGSRLGRLVPTLPFVFLSATLVVGPWVLVNVLLKGFWGRPRPTGTDLFGGTMPFMPAWVPGGQCPSNCSFVSGESASSFWLLAFAFVVPPRYRAAVAAMALVWATAISANRVAFGGHYLSDAVLAWAIVGVVLVAAWRLLLDGAPPDRAARIDAAIDGIRRRLRRT
jgi:membrane-associated phospholipid phosphatase